LTFWAARCSAMALALPSRSVATTKALSCTVPEAETASAALSSKSRVAVPPAVTLTEAEAEPWPV
jgi:hypothetical protein